MAMSTRRVVGKIRPVRVKPPRNLVQLNARLLYNQEVTGYGAETATHMPCPFCAARDWKIIRITDVDQVEMQRDSACRECGRSAKFVVTRSDTGVTAEMVQTGGDDPPDWFDLKPRRVPEVGTSPLDA